MSVRSQWNWRFRSFVAALLLFPGMGCVGLVPGSPQDHARGGLDYFQRPAPDDVWSPKIEGWQRRERFDAALLHPLESGPAVESAGYSAANEQLPEDQA
ncbi:MAG TPA: hypothetical protein ENI85_13280, partial [Deltaproteobacteria bacterium]|nr:hypothetical protein [Deltaproteobacteria bacterium]